MSMAIFSSLMAATLFVRINLLPDFMKRDSVVHKYERHVCRLFGGLKFRFQV